MTDPIGLPEARLDLDEIWDFIRADRLDAADRVLAEIFSAMPRQCLFQIKVTTRYRGRGMVLTRSWLKVASLCSAPARDEFGTPDNISAACRTQTSVSNKSRRHGWTR